jgi:hypothetical protein
MTAEQWLTAGAVEETVSSLDSCIHLVCAGLVGDLPQAEAHEGHVEAAVQFDCGRRHVAILCIPR